jgi:hypothetical protein
MRGKERGGGKTESYEGKKEGKENERKGERREGNAKVQAKN